MTAEEIMTADVATVNESSTVADALEVLAELDIRHLPVIRGAELTGMISDRDLREMGLTRIGDLEDVDRIRSLGSTSVAEVMNTDLITVDPSATVTELIDIMVQEKVGAIPVVDDHNSKLMGIVSYVDVLRAAAELL
jgi:acetoin utilization protein AcuB